MGFDPNEPRDAIGRWTASIKSAIRNAAIDEGEPKKIDPLDQEGIIKTSENDNKVADLAEEEIKKLTGSKDVELNGLSAAEATDTLAVIKEEAEKNGWPQRMTEAGINAHYYESDDNAVASYGYNGKTDKGKIDIYIQAAHRQVPFDDPSTVTYDQKIKHLQDGIAASQKDFDARDEYTKVLNLGGFEKWKAQQLDKIERFKIYAAAGKQPMAWTISNNTKDPDDKFKAVLYHELGHMRLREGFNEQHRTLNYRETTYAKWKEENMGQEMKNNPITDYSMTNTDEFFAENYSAYKMGRPISKKMEAFIHSLNLK